MIVRTLCARLSGLDWVDARQRTERSAMSNDVEKLRVAAASDSRKVLLSDRLRPDVECAPWVIGEVKQLEHRIASNPLQGENAELRNALEHAEARLRVYSEGAGKNDTELSCMILPMIRRALKPLRPAPAADQDGKWLDIPPFLRRNTTPEEHAAWEAKPAAEATHQTAPVEALDGLRDELMIHARACARSADMTTDVVLSKLQIEAIADAMQRAAAALTHQPTRKG